MGMQRPSGLFLIYYPTVFFLTWISQSSTEEVFPSLLYYAFLCESCQSKVAETGRLSTMEVTVSQFRNIEAQDQGVSSGGFL